MSTAGARLIAVEALARESPASDEEIVTRVLAGHRELFAVLMRRHNQRLYRLLYALLGDPADAQDAMQETYLKAFANLGGFRRESRFATWITGIALNEARAGMRREQRRRAHGAVQELAHDEAKEKAQMVPFPGVDPERAARDAELRRAMERAVSALPEPFRAVFMLRAVEELSVDETARVLGLKPATVKTRLHRAKRLLREKLWEYADAAGPACFPFAGPRCDRMVARVMTRLLGARVVVRPAAPRLPSADDR